MSKQSNQRYRKEKENKEQKKMTDMDSSVTGAGQAKKNNQKQL